MWQSLLGTQAELARTRRQHAPAQLAKFDARWKQNQIRTVEWGEETEYLVVIASRRLNRTHVLILCLSSSVRVLKALK